MDLSLKWNPQYIEAMVAEFLATALFVWIGVGSAWASAAFGGPLSAALGFGFGIVCLAYTFGGISGGHINPAVTWGLFVAGEIPLLKAALYVLSQVLGGMVGALLVYAGYPDAKGPGDLASNKLARGVSAGSGLALEIVGTFLLVNTVFLTAVLPSEENSALAMKMQSTSANAPLAIGFAVFLAHAVMIPATNCGINPARSFGPSLISGTWDDHWLFWVGPLMGSTLAAVLYRFYWLRLGQARVSKAASGKEGALVYPTAA